LSEEFPKIKTIRYLGSKRKLVNRICKLISDKVARGSTVLDMFSGTNCISYGLKKSLRVFSNDAQVFSYIIAKTLLMNRDRISVSEAKEDLEQRYWDNYEILAKYYKGALNKERNLLNIPVERFKEYADFCNSSQQIANLGNYLPQIKNDNGRIRRSHEVNFPYYLFTTYFSNAYFGLKQSLQIDSLRFAIDMLKSSNRRRKNLYLCALIYAIDSCVASPGHFAQFFTPHSQKSYATILREREKNVRATFYNMIEYFCENLYPSNFEHEAWCTDYVNLFNTSSKFYSKMKEVDLIYADPPYTADHYSRFYHVLETLVEYDYPEVDGKGRYRGNRFVSNFSIRSKVYSEFEKLFSLVSSIRCKLLVSYNNDGLISSKQLIELSRKYFAKVHYDDLKYNHSNQGRKNADCRKKRNPRKEYLIYCEN